MSGRGRRAPAGAGYNGPMGKHDSGSAVGTPRRQAPVGRPGDPRFGARVRDTLGWLAEAGPQPLAEVAARLVAGPVPNPETAAALLPALPRLEVGGGQAAVCEPFWCRRRFVIVDLETTGVRPNGARGITEVAAWRVEGGRLVDRFVELVHPGEPIPPMIRDLTGINDAMVADAPSFAELAPRLRAFLGDDPWLAHNLSFDAGYLEAGFAACGLDAPPPLRICTLRWARRVLPGGRHGLGALVERLGLEAAPSHRAESDVAATHQLALALCHLTPPPVRSFSDLAGWLAGRRIRPGR